MAEPTPMSQSERWPQWKLDLFRTRLADLEARGAAHAAGRPSHAPVPGCLAPRAGFPSGLHRALYGGDAITSNEPESDEGPEVF